MELKFRVLLVILSSSLILSLAQATQFNNHPREGKPMERVSGIGGFFFKSKDPKALAAWYEANLGITPPTSYEEPPWQQEAGSTVFAPFAKDTTYFGSKNWMINFRVRNLDAMVAQLRHSGNQVEVDPQQYPNGRFASLSDPEGNPIQLWEPFASSGKGSLKR